MLSPQESGKTQQHDCRADDDDTHAPINRLPEQGHCSESGFRSFGSRLMEMNPTPISRKTAPNRIVNAGDASLRPAASNKSVTGGAGRSGAPATRGQCARSPPGSRLQSATG